MKPLQGDKYSTCNYKYILKVPDNYHLKYDGHYYSVLYTYRGRPAILKVAPTEIMICDRNNVSSANISGHIKSFLNTSQMTAI